MLGWHSGDLSLWNLAKPAEIISILLMFNSLRLYVTIRQGGSIYLAHARVRSNAMDTKMTFQDWLNESPNNKPDKGWNLQYIQKLNENLESSCDNVNVSLWMTFLRWVDSPFGDFRIEESSMVSALRILSLKLNDLKTDHPKYFALFGEDFGREYNTTYKKAMDKRVGDCKTALDQYARFLRGVDSRLARHADYVRYHYEPEIIAAKAAGTNPLMLENIAKEIHNLIDDPQSMTDALNIKKMERLHGIVDVKMVDGRFRVTFG